MDSGKAAKKAGSGRTGRMIRNGVKEMISKKMENMVANSSAIRAMFEEGNRLAKIYGAENVYDFSWAIRMYRHRRQ